MHLEAELGQFRLLGTHLPLHIQDFTGVEHQTVDGFETGMQELATVPHSFQ